MGLVFFYSIGLFGYVHVSLSVSVLFCNMTFVNEIIVLLDPVFDFVFVFVFGVILYEIRSNQNTCFPSNVDGSCVTF